MDTTKIIEYKITTLINLLATKGVSPGDLANNIFENDYFNITFEKRNKFIYGILVFRDNLENKKVELIYKYDENKILLEIIENVDRKITILWSREKREEELIDDIVFFYRIYYNKEQVEKMINTLPVEIINRLNDKVKIFIA